MTKRDFELIARVVRGWGDESGDQPIRDAARQGIARAFAAELSLINPRFDRARFLKACGVEQGN